MTFTKIFMIIEVFAFADDKSVIGFKIFFLMSNFPPRRQSLSAKLRETNGNVAIVVYFLLLFYSHFLLFLNFFIFLYI